MNDWLNAEILTSKEAYYIWHLCSYLLMNIIDGTSFQV